MLVMLTFLLGTVVVPALSVRHPNGLPGITVTVNSLTDFTGGVNALNNLVLGDHVRIRGRASSGNTVIATQVDKRSADTLIELQGTIQSITGSSTSQIVTILGIAVDTSGFSSSNGFLDVDASIITRSAFFAKAAVGTLVKANGALGGKHSYLERDRAGTIAPVHVPDRVTMARLYGGPSEIGGIHVHEEIEYLIRRQTGCGGVRLDPRHAGA